MTFPLCKYLSFIYRFWLLLLNYLMLCKHYEIQEGGYTVNDGKVFQKIYIFSFKKPVIWTLL